MSWTMNTNMKEFLAETGGLIQFFNGYGTYLELYESTNLMARCHVNNAIGDGIGNVALTFDAGTINSGTWDPDNGKIVNSGGGTVYATCNSIMLTTGGDINLDDITALTTGGQLVPGTLTFSMVNMTLATV